MNNSLNTNYLRVLPLSLALIIGFIGWIFRWHYSDLAICKDPPVTTLDFECAHNAVSVIGDPALQLFIWLIPIALVVFFSPLILIKRWLVFGGIYLLLTAIVINIAGDDGGMFYSGREFVAGVLGILMLAITLIWLAAHLFFYRKTKGVNGSI